MKISNIISWSILQVTSFIFLLFYLLGLLNIHFSDKSDYCQMTYMFEYPQFVRLSLSENELFPGYGLYAYSEGRFTERARKMWFDGIPVLFLPGNGGSHMQVRSLSSVALRKSLSNGYEYHFDFFTVSFNEELSALYGGVLNRQTKFAAACVKRILSLYKNNKYTKSVPSSVILIGHSMGGLIAKRLLINSDTVNMTTLAIAMASPLLAPILNVDSEINLYYLATEHERFELEDDETIKENKMLISIGSGPRDLLVPSGFTISAGNSLNVLATSIPGVWLSPNHVSIVWCKQLVLVVNRYLFDIIDPNTEQIIEKKSVLYRKAKQYFQANHSMTLNPKTSRANVTMQVDAFWYEDSRRIYQISRPEIERTTYLMIRLLAYPQNRFVAIEGINVENRDWIFGCEAKYTHNTYRYCKYGTSLAELSRWTPAATDFGKRKLATIHLHSIKEKNPEWTHVIVKVSPAKKPVVLNIDSSDYNSRQINTTVGLFSYFQTEVLILKTERNSIYYEILINNFNLIHQAYLLYVEPTSSCKAATYHVSAEVRVPWAENQDYYHYFTPTKRSPLKLRLFSSDPNVFEGFARSPPVKVTLLLDPQCTFTISITGSWYHTMAQLARNYSPALVSYVAAIIILATRGNIRHIKQHGVCSSLFQSLSDTTMNPFFVLVALKMASFVVKHIPIISLLIASGSWYNLDMRYFSESLWIFPMYMTALGIANLVAGALTFIMIFSSQSTHKLFFRIISYGSSRFEERVVSLLQKVPVIMSAILLSMVPVSCGAASIAVGFSIYSFMISKRYEEHLEDCMYKFISKVVTRIRQLFKLKNKKTKVESENNLVTQPNTPEPPTDDLKGIKLNNEENVIAHADVQGPSNDGQVIDDGKSPQDEADGVPVPPDDPTQRIEEVPENDEQLPNLHFHMMLYFIWFAVLLVNLPPLLTWAKNFKYRGVLEPDTSSHVGFVISISSIIVWQLDGPRKNLKHYDTLANMMYLVAIVLLLFGPQTLVVVNYGLAYTLAAIAIQQTIDCDDVYFDFETFSLYQFYKRQRQLIYAEQNGYPGSNQNHGRVEGEEVEDDRNDNENANNNDDVNDNDDINDNEDVNNDVDVGNDEDANDNDDQNGIRYNYDEGRLFEAFKQLKEKFSFNE